MGDIADAMLDGTLCNVCGVFIDSDSGIPTNCGCDESQDYFEPEPPEPTRFICPDCGRNKFDRPHQPHNCTGGFRKKWSKIWKAYKESPDEH